MIYSYKELKALNNQKQIKKLLETKELFRIEKGYYSDRKHYDNLELITKKYPNAIFTAESAFFYWGLTDYIPDKYYLATANNIKSIQDDNIKQFFITNDFFEIGKTKLNYNGVEINIYDKERMLIELAKNKNIIAYDYYKELIIIYRNILEDLDISKLAKYLKHFKNGDNILETIHREVF